MDDKMIIDFINNIEPDTSYGTSESMARAMVESAENMALINDYIVESTYEVYTEAEDKQGFFSKVKNKIHRAFVLFVNIIKKAIEKVKGFFMTIKRKLTMVIAKALKTIMPSFAKAANLASAIKTKASGEKGVFSLDFTHVVVCRIDPKKLVRLLDYVNYCENAYKNIKDLNFLDETVIKTGDNTLNQIRNSFDSFIKQDADETGSPIMEKYNFTINVAGANMVRAVKNQFDDIKGYMSDVYGDVMKSYSSTLKNIQSLENSIKKNDKITNNELSKQLSIVNKYIHFNNYIKYTILQKTATACLKHAKSFISAMWYLIKHPKRVMTF